MQESSISEKIKELRTDLKMNQKNFSAAIGIRQSTLSSYENGVVTPSNDVLLTIAQKFHVSLDWLFGLSENKVQISTLSDIIWVLLQMNESNELRYELDINNKLPGDIETETQKWYAGLRFYGNDPEHSLNADMCNFLADLQENRESLESYFTGRYAKIFIFFPYLPVFNLFAILYSLILNFLHNRKTPETLRFRGILRLDTMYLAVLYIYIKMLC